MMNVWSCCVAGFFAVACCLVVEADEANEKKPDVPVKRVVMYSSGVAFYEHRGNVQGNASLELAFNVRDINDLLKSMVLQDLGGGHVSSVSYASQDPIAKTLHTFSIDLSRNPTLGDLLHQIRGEKIEIEAPAKTSGVIIGLELRQMPTEKGASLEVPYLNLLTDDGLQSLSLQSVGKIKLVNPKLDAELRQALLLLATAKSTEKKSVALNFRGEGQRAVRVGYIQESPIWKTSYRLVLKDDEKPLLQGWAIVDNTTESDWNDIDLTLVSGRPISFVMDLYQPLYLARPKVVPELFASLRPRTYDQDLAAAEEDFRAASRRGQPGNPNDGTFAAGPNDRNQGMGGMGGGMGGGGFGGGVGGGGSFGGSGGASRARQRAESSMGEALLGKESKAEGWNLAGTAPAAATVSDAGELFHYEIAVPVTLSRGKSAMLPIVNETIAGEKLVVYNESQHAKHPLHSLRLKNTTALHLMQGPITVFDEGAYAGDAQIEDLQPKSERLVSYAMDLDTEVAASPREEATSLVGVRLERGSAIISQRRTRTRTYVVKNSGQQTKQLLVEYPIEANWNLIEPKEPTEKTRSSYRFALEVEPGKPAKLAVREEYTVSERAALTNWDDQTIAFYIAAKETTAEVKQALAELSKLKLEISEAAAKRQEFERQTTAITAEQSRLRANMAELSEQSELFRRYEAKLTKQEDELEDLRGELNASIEHQSKLQRSLLAFLAALELQ